MYDLFPYFKSQSEYLNPSVLVLHMCQKSEFASTPSSPINKTMSNNRDYKDGPLKNMYRSLDIRHFLSMFVSYTGLFLKTDT